MKENRKVLDKLAELLIEKSELGSRSSRLSLSRMTRQSKKCKDSLCKCANGRKVLGKTNKRMVGKM